MKANFLHFGRAVFFSHLTEKKNFARIVITVVDLLTHMISNLIGENQFFHLLCPCSTYGHPNVPSPDGSAHTRIGGKHIGTLECPLLGQIVQNSVF
jgi:hypothetical protein